ncbi:V-type ATP synthase subunit D [bacterium]|nr:V-type ATP synthase subunit D [bacterium]
MELLRLKKRIVIARRGHKLLKDKQDELMRRFMDMIKGYRELRYNVEEKLADAFKVFILSRAVTRKEYFEEAFLGKKESLEVQVSSFTIMNIKAPKFELKSVPDFYTYGFSSTPVDMDRSLALLSEALPLMVQLAQIEKGIELLAEEIERTRRRVNALEYVLIPSLQETIKHITMRLAEMERSNLTRLMKVKDIVRAH